MHFSIFYVIRDDSILILVDYDYPRALLQILVFDLLLPTNSN